MQKKETDFVGNLWKFFGAIFAEKRSDLHCFDKCFSKKRWQFCPVWGEMISISLHVCSNNYMYVYSNRNMPTTSGHVSVAFLKLAILHENLSNLFGLSYV